MILTDTYRYPIAELSESTEPTWIDPQKGRFPSFPPVFLPISASSEVRSGVPAEAEAAPDLERWEPSGWTRRVLPILLSARSDEIDVQVHLLASGVFSIITMAFRHSP